MKPPSDLGDILVEEVMCDMAETFFGSRVEIDEMLELFEKYAEELKKKERRCCSQGWFFKYVVD